MKKIFVRTASVERAEQDLKKALAERRMLLVQGPAGSGKTETIRKLVVREGGLIIRACAHWNAKTFLQSLLEALRGQVFEDHVPSMEMMYSLVRRQIRAASPNVIAIDESDCLAGRHSRWHLLNIARDIYDDLGVPLVFISVTALAWYLATPGDGFSETISSRIAATVRFERATAKEAQQLARELVEVSLSADLVDFCLKRANGSIRLLVSIFTEIEALVKAAGETRCDLAQWRRFQEALAGEPQSSAAGLKLVVK
jgi:Cdc6-like AAA superfamily ATPase